MDNLISTSFNQRTQGCFYIIIRLLSISDYCQDLMNRIMDIFISKKSEDKPMKINVSKTVIYLIGIVVLIVLSNHNPYSKKYVLDLQI